MTNHMIHPTFSLVSSSSGSTFLSKDYFGRKPAQRRRGWENDFDPHDGNASLTYSAASSVAGDSVAGESTDSSFAGIMQVLDAEETSGVKNLTRKKEDALESELRNRKMASSQSVASSLTYSTDGQSHLEGISLLETITGVGQTDRVMLFAPAEPGRITKNKRAQNLDPQVPRSRSGEYGGSGKKPSVERSRKSSSIEPTTPPSRRESQTHHGHSPSSSEDTPTRSPPVGHSTPPRQKNGIFYVEDAANDDEIWYSKWWFFCLPEGARNMMFKR